MSKFEDTLDEIQAELEGLKDIAAEGLTTDQIPVLKDVVEPGVMTADQNPSLAHEDSALDHLSAQISLELINPSVEKIRDQLQHHLDQAMDDLRQEMQQTLKAHLAEWIKKAKHG